MAGVVKHQFGTQRALIMKAIKPEGSYVFEIAAACGLEQRAVSKTLSNLVRVGSVIKVKVEGVDRIFRYLMSPKTKLPSLRANVATVSFAEATQALLVVDQGGMWHRLAMLKRLREKLIEEHHPLLNAVIADYEFTLHAEDKEDALQK